MIDEEVEITVGGHLGIEATTLDDHGPVLTPVYRTVPGQTVSKSTLQAFHTGVLDRDDVFQPEFYRNVVFYGSKKEDLNFEPDASDYLSAWNTESTYFVAGEADVAPGPYGVKGGRSWQPWRIYHDFNSVFMTTFKPAADGSGRLGLDRPLDGARITVKDNIDIAGHKTSLCNKAWLELYPEKTKTAACVQVLIDAGAIILGKVKLQAMIMREEPLECVEFTAPFNPRADGYQVPSGSSHASAAGVASYDWLDFSIGSDSMCLLLIMVTHRTLTDEAQANGSGRKPASNNGCYSIRPSTGIMDTEGVVGQFP
ncbi:hypothetical protein Daus18300_001848 [Diaporthe australafricana]|uniref:Amidase domain-containing protein n=1 Tax=Diaporthe australafricana TaxID=127596 RepID=A0ABR3XU61_9PEZI